MIRILTNLRTIKPTLIYRFSNNTKEGVYVPIRTLKAPRNTVFSIGDPEPISFPQKVLIFTPFFATALDGYINEWNNWRIAGSVVFLWLGFRILKYINFGKAHHVHTLKLSKDLSKFYITLPNNRYTMKMEQVLLERENKTFQQRFKEELKNKTLEVPDKLYEILEKANEKELKQHMGFLKRSRDGVILEVDRKDIKSIEFISKKEMRRVIRDNMLTEIFDRNRKTSVLEQYSAVNEQKDYILIVTKPFEKWNNHPIHFIVNFAANADKKYEEYLRALAQGKKIET